MTHAEKEDLKILLDYMWRDEETHYQSSSRKNHIFTILKRLAKRVGYQVA